MFLKGVFLLDPYIQMSKIQNSLGMESMHFYNCCSQSKINYGMVAYKNFETERLFIRPTSEKDADFIFELLNTPKWIENIGDRNITSVEVAKEYIMTKMRPQLERLGYSSYTLVSKMDNGKIGTCGLYERDG